MAYRPEAPPDKEIFPETGKSRRRLSLLKKTGESGEGPTAVDQVIDDRTIAVLIDSTVLGAPIWFALRDDWRPDEGDSTPVFYASELPALRTKTPEQLRTIFNVKTGLGGGRVVQDPDPSPPDCRNCGVTMTRTKDVSGKTWWACWACAKTA